MNDEVLTILSREEGPAMGLTSVTVAVGTNERAIIVVRSHLVGTVLEMAAIRRGLESRKERQDAIEGEQI